MGYSDKLWTLADTAKGKKSPLIQTADKKLRGVGVEHRVSRTPDKAAITVNNVHLGNNTRRRAYDKALNKSK